MGTEDPELVAACRRGDGAAFEALYRAHVGRVTAYLERSGFSSADADDLAQQVFLRVFRSLETFDSARGSFAAWLAAIARNVARKHWRRRKDPEHFDPELAEQTLWAPENPSDSAQSREQVAAVRECVEALPPDLVRLVRMRYVEGRTTRGIAAAERMAEATVRLRLQEARQVLARCLKAKGILE